MKTTFFMGCQEFAGTSQLSERLMNGGVTDSMRIWLNLLDQARHGANDALGDLLDQVRSLLMQIAVHELDSDIRAKEGCSDVVQQSLLEAARDFQKFQGKSEEEFRQWLRQILLNNVRDLVEKFLAEKRRISREQGAAEGVEVADGEDPPVVHVVRQEEIEALHQAMARLSPEQREVLRLRHQEDLDFYEMGERLGITHMAAQKRWARAVEELRDLMSGMSDSSVPGG